MVLQSTRQGNSIFDEIKYRLYKQKLLDSQFAYETYTEDDELVEAIETIEDVYTLNLFKLDEIADLANQPHELQRKFITQKLYIETLGVAESVQIESILTTACILNNFSNDVIHLCENQLYLLTCVLLNKDHRNGDRYKKVISDILISFKNVEGSKTKNMNHQN